MSKTKVIIQPDADGLASLLFPEGPDSDAALELRQFVLNRLAEAYLKPVVNTPEFQDALSDVKAKIVAVVRDEYLVKTSSGWGDRYVIKPEIEKQVSTAVRQATSALIKEAVNGAVADINTRVASQFSEIDANVKEIAAAQAKRTNERFEEAGFEKRLDAAVERYFAKKFTK